MKKQKQEEKREDDFFGYEYNYYRIWEKLQQLKEQYERIHLCGMGVEA